MSQFRRLAALTALSLAAASAQWPTAGWLTSTPEEQGMDSARLEQASQFIEANCPTRYSLLVVRNGRIVFERYYNGSQATDANNIKSMSKSVLSVLTGIAVEEGRIRGLDQKLHEFFPEYFQDWDDARKRDITLAHLLTMTAGFHWAENTMISALLFSSSDWHRYIIESPLTSAPGEVFNYNTALTHLLSGIITKSTGESTLSYANSRLFDPLGITCHHWSLDPRGYYFGGSEVWLTARDLAKFGLLVLRNGRWEDRQVVSEGWLRDSTRLRVRTGSPLGDYGWLWWKYTLQGYPLTIASGYGGQYVLLLPELDLMMVTTARSNIPNQPDLVYSQPFELFWRYVIPAVTVPAPKLTAGGVVNAADYGDRFAPGVFATAFGSDLSVATREWGSVFPSDGRLPDALAGVRVRIGGRTAYPAFVSPTQVNFLIPPDMAPGRHKVEIITPQGRSSQEVEVGEAAPAFFSTWREGRAFVKPAPVRAGGYIELWASGLGSTDPATPVGIALEHHLPLAVLPEVTIGGRKAHVEYAALAYPGVCQVNVRVPEDVPPGLAAVELRTAGGINSLDAFLEVAP